MTGFWRPSTVRILLHRRLFSQSYNKMERNYNDAVAALNTLQTNAAVIAAIKQSGMKANELAIPEMIEWLRRVGYQPSDLNRLNCIHVAGTKGKGSTCAFVSSILAQYLSSARSEDDPTSHPLSKPVISKLGLYTSPHLRAVRERIQIDNIPLSELLFAQYFFELWDRLEASALSEGRPKTDKPAYFRYLTLLAFHTYIRESVNTAIIEVGIGGEHDSTNIIPRPTVTGITSLGIDHTATLGNTIEEIAWHKAGVMKPGVPSFTVPQPDAATPVLQSRATERSTTLTIVPRHPDLANTPLGLEGDHQKTNASLAIALAASHLHILDPTFPTSLPATLPPPFRRGLAQVHWPGRCETRHEGPLTWYLDGGHTLDSIALAGSWFASVVSPPSAAQSPEKKKTRILIFNQQTRDAPALATALHSTLAPTLGTQHPFGKVLFSTNITWREAGYKPDLIAINYPSVEALTVQHGLAECWRGLDPEAEVGVVGSVEEAVEEVRRVVEGGGEVDCLVTGSVHLIGGVLEVLETGGQGRG